MSSDTAAIFNAVADAPGSTDGVATPLRCKRAAPDMSGPLPPQEP